MITAYLLSLDSPVDILIPSFLYILHIYIIYLIDYNYLLFHIYCPCWMVNFKRIEV